GGATTKTTGDYVLEQIQESVHESVAVPDATTTESGQSDDADVPPDNKTNNIIDSYQKNASESIAVEDA
ncbi:hypothetical protein A2U01_0114191, partial [Trifolium medium]|nr:hypothetical protein [Trifolium medium]